MSVRFKKLMKEHFLNRIGVSNMSKSTYFTGQPVYSQVIKLLDKANIQQISLETLGSERYVKRLTGWKHLIIMLFGVLNTL